MDFCSRGLGARPVSGSLLLRLLGRVAVVLYVYEDRCCSLPRCNKQLVLAVSISGVSAPRSELILCL